MNKYEYLMQQFDLCEMMAGLYAQVEDKKMAAFYYNAAAGYKIKAENLKLNGTSFF